ncbi:MAG: DUF4093 domain-containing protein [Erysipelotrichaceae bacterium]|jgi:ribonuclease M5|nr:DUF4093 domain-containing protein [Erysipelotrichaceae bacterium]
MPKESLKYHLEGVLVVEGRHDVTFLSNFLDTCYAITKGYFVPRETIIFLKQLEDEPIYVMLDPDGPGRQIEMMLKSEGLFFTAISLDKKSARNRHGVGVEYASKEAVLTALQPFLHHQPLDETKDSALLELELLRTKITKLQRNILGRYFKFGTNLSSRDFMSRLRVLKISPNQIIEVLGHE